MSWKNQLRKDSLPWLLEPANPGVRYLALRDLFDLDPDARECRSARKVAYKEGPIAVVLSHMEQEGYWIKPGPGYNPKYRSTVWSMILLAQLGASAREDPHLAQACTYLLDHMAEGGRFTSTTSGAPSGTIDCLQGNLLWSLMELGYEDPRIDKAFEWMARTVTGKLPCAWGGVKVMMAFGKLPTGQRTPLIKKAIQQGKNFFLSIDPATAQYPMRAGEKPSRNWWKFGFPLFYITDLLQLAEAMIGIGYGNNTRLSNTLSIVRNKQDNEGRWPLEYDYTGKTWIDFGKKKQPNKWVTLRALRVLKALN